MQVLILGCGYVGKAFGLALSAKGAQVFGTTRTQAGGEVLQASGIEPILFEGNLNEGLAQAAQKADIVLQSIPPTAQGDLAIAALSPLWASGNAPHWCGYLSTTGVYGDRQGGWAFEVDAPTPLSVEAKRRKVAESQWLALSRPAHIFRLPGIYGPGRSAIEQLRAGTARRIDRPGQVFSRAHRDDIVTALLASIEKPKLGRIYNVCDDHPCASGEVIVEAARLLNVDVPPLVPFEQAGLSEMGRRFYSECKRVSNARIKAELGWRPQFPTYVEGLADCLARA